MHDNIVIFKKTTWDLDLADLLIGSEIFNPYK